MNTVFREFSDKYGVGSKAFQTSKDSIFILLLGFLLVTLTGCEEGTPVVGSTRSGSNGGAGPTPTPSNLPPKTVTITWTASSAKQVGLAGGGYFIYVAPTSKAIGTVVPIRVNNPGNGSHVTTTTTSLTPGNYNFAVRAFSSDSTSEFSTITNFRVP